MWFRPKLSVIEQSPAVTVDGVLLQPAFIQKYLGVLFDDQLRWHSYISHVCKKISYYLYWINAHYKHLPTDVLK